MPRVWAYTVMRNESVMMPYWLRHYGSFCERLIVYDDASDDDSAAIARAGGAEVRPYPYAGLDDQHMVDLAHQTYPEARGQADWIVWSDTDELVYHPRIAARLDELLLIGVTAPAIEGFSMLASAPPTGAGQIYDEIRTGIPDFNYSKQVIIHPRVDIRWKVGKHIHEYLGPVNVGGGEDPLKLLHYRWLGRAYFVARNEHHFARLSDRNRANSWGVAVTPGYVGDHSVEWFEERTAHASDCVS